MFRKREDTPGLSEIGLRPDVDRRLQVSAVMVGMFVARLNAHEHGLVRLVAWFLGYYLGDPVLDWIIWVPHLIESADRLPTFGQWPNLKLDEFEEAGHLTQEDCKVFLRIMYPRCRNILRHYRWFEKNQEWLDVGASNMLFPELGSKIIGRRRRCGQCSRHHPLRLLHVLEKQLGPNLLRHLFPFAAYIIRMAPPKDYMNALKSVAISGYTGQYGIRYGTEWCCAFKEAYQDGGRDAVMTTMLHRVPRGLRIEEYNRASHRHEAGPKQRTSSAKFRCVSHYVEVENKYRATWCADPEHPLELAVPRPGTCLQRSVGIFVPGEWDNGPVYNRVYRLQN